MRLSPFAGTLILAATLPLAAMAHVTLETGQAVAGSTSKLVLRVPHGCEGSPTTSLRVQIPEGVTDVKPMPKPGWQLTVVRAKLATPMPDGHGGQITEAVREVAWSGGRLPEEHYDEFVFRVALPDKAGSVIHFPVVQECATGTSRWIEVPTAGESARQPAPALRLLPKP